MQEAPIHQSHVYKQIKFLTAIFEKGHPKNILVKLFQNRTSLFGEEFLHVPLVQEAPIHLSHVFRWINIS